MQPLRTACLGLALTLPSLYAQSADARASWANLSANIVAAAAAVPESDYSFKPVPTVRSFGQLVGHLADAQFMFCGPMLPQYTPRTGAEKLTSKAELIAALKASVTACTSAADQTTDANTTPVKLFGRDVARITVLWTNISHSFEHYGNIVTYMRIKGLVPPSSARTAATARVYYDQGHGELGPPPDMAIIGTNAGFFTTVGEGLLSAARLKNTKLLYLRAPSKPFAPDEKAAIVEYVKTGGSLLLVLDEEQRQSLAGTEVNDILKPFDMRLTPDTPYVHNCGAIAKAGEIHKQDREVPYSGGRAVEGGTPFAWQLDKEGKQGPAFAASKKLDGGGRIVVMAEGMASIFLGEPNGERLTGEPRNFAGTHYWGKDSAIFMQEVIAWLIAR